MTVGTIELFGGASDATARADLAAHKADVANPHQTNAAQIGLGNVDNTADADKPISTAASAALALKAPLASPALTGTPTAPTAAPGTATTQIATTAFAAAGDNVVKAASDAVAADLAAHTARSDNPHGNTAAQLGLGNVDDTSDVDKPVSTAQQIALNLKANLASPALTGTPTAPTAPAGTNTTQIATTAFVAAAAAAVEAEFSNVNNTADADKPVSTATQIALNLKAPLASPALTGIPTAPTAAPGTNTTQLATTAFAKGEADAAAADAAAAQADIDAHAARVDNPHATNKTQVGLGSVDDTSDADKPVSTAQQAALDLKAPLSSPALTGAPTAPTAAIGTATTQIASTDHVKTAVVAGVTPERPGDGLTLFGAAATGAPDTIIPLPSSWLINSASGRVVRVTGGVADDPQFIAPIAGFALESGRVYELRYKVQRQTDPLDPLNDSVTLGIRWIDNAKAGVAVGGTTTIEDIALTVADGVQERVVRIALSATDGVDYVAPAGTVYCRPFVEMFGAAHVTDVIVIEVTAIVVSPIIFGALRLPMLADDPAAGPGLNRAALYLVDAGDGTASLRIQGGTSATAFDIYVGLSVT